MRGGISSFLELKYILVWLTVSANGGGDESCWDRLTLHWPGEKDEHMKRNQLEVTSRA